MANFAAADRTNPPPAGAVLFVGSSSIRLWKSLAEDFKGTAVINRGFGGSQMEDVVHWTDRIILPYRPRQIFVYEGDNDLAAGKSAERVANDFAALVEKVRKALPGVHLTYIAIKPSPSRWHLAEKIRTANALIAIQTRKQAGLDFADVFTPMLGADGQPRAELFIADQLHMNEKGYQLWTSILRPFLLP